MSVAFLVMLGLLSALQTAAPGQLAVPQPSRLRVEVQSEARPVADATILAGAQRAATGADGIALLVLEPGQHSLVVSAGGYLPFETQVTLEAGSETHLIVELTRAIELQEEIVVRAARTERRLEDQPVRVEVVDREDIEEKALMTPGSVAMLLSETTGLRVQNTSPSTGASNVRIQGLRGRYSQLLSDGLTLYGAQGNSLNLLQVPPLDLGQVEIIKGAASALYGPSAVGGVINLVSQQPRRRHRELLLNASTQQAGDLTFWATEPPRGNWAYTLIGGLHGQQRQDLDEDGWADLPAYGRGVLRPRVFWSGDAGRTVFATVGVMAENRRGGTMPGRTAPDDRPFAQGLDTRRIDGGVVSRLPVGTTRVISIRGSFSHQRENRRFAEAQDHGRRSTWFAETVLQGASGRHIWVIGGSVQQELYDNRDFPAFDYSFVTPSLILQDEIALGDRATLGLSGRVDAHSEYGTFASPRVSLLLRPNPQWTFRLSAGTGFFAPTPFVEEIEETGLSRLEPLPELKAERVRSASFDTTWSRGPVELVATLFGSVVRDPVEREFVGRDRVALSNDSRSVRTWGTELLARYRTGRFLLLATHNYTSSTEGDPFGPGRRDVPLNPRHSASLNAIWEDEDQGRVGLEAYYTGRQPLELNPYRSTGRSYVLLGVLAEKRFERFRVFVNLENLTDVRQTHWEPLLRREPLADGRWTVDAWAPLDGRVINGGVRLFF
ncbi:MAG: ligand-gated channel protein [Acidobacteriota bacterium]